MIEDAMFNFAHFVWGGLKFISKEEDGEWSFFCYDKGYLVNQYCYAPYGRRNRSARVVANWIWEDYHYMFNDYNRIEI